MNGTVGPSFWSFFGGISFLSLLAVAWLLAEAFVFWSFSRHAPGGDLRADLGSLCHRELHRHLGADVWHVLRWARRLPTVLHFLPEVQRRVQVSVGCTALCQTTARARAAFAVCCIIFH